MLPSSSASPHFSIASTVESPETNSDPVLSELAAIRAASSQRGITDEELARRMAARKASSTHDEVGMCWIERLWGEPAQREAWFDTLFELRAGGRLTREFTSLMSAAQLQKAALFELGSDPPKPLMSRHPLLHKLMGLHRDQVQTYFDRLLDAAGKGWLPSADLHRLARGDDEGVRPADTQRPEHSFRIQSALAFAIQNRQSGNITAFETFLDTAREKRLLDPQQIEDLHTLRKPGTGPLRNDSPR